MSEQDNTELSDAEIADRLYVAVKELCDHLSDAYEAWCPIPVEQRGRYRGDMEQAGRILAQYQRVRWQEQEK